MWALCFSRKPEGAHGKRGAGSYLLGVGCDVCKTQVKRPRVQVTMLGRRIARCPCSFRRQDGGLLWSVGSVRSYSPSSP